MNAPSFVPYTEQMKMMPIYSLTEGLSNKMIASAVETGLRLTDDAVFDRFRPTLQRTMVYVISILLCTTFIFRRIKMRWKQPENGWF